MLMDPARPPRASPPLTYEIRPVDGGYCSLTLTHDCEGAPTRGAHDRQPARRRRRVAGGGGHAWILSDLKSLLETGTKMVPNSPAAD